MNNIFSEGRLPEVDTSASGMADETSSTSSDRVELKKTVGLLGGMSMVVGIIIGTCFENDIWGYEPH